MAIHETKLRTAEKELRKTPRQSAKESQDQAAQPSASAQLRSSTVAMRRVTGGGSVLSALEGSGDAETRVAALQVLSSTDHTHGRGEGVFGPTVPLGIEKEAIVEVAAGATPRHVEVKYDLQAGYVQHALRRRFGSSEAAKRALQGLVLENALACQVVAAQELHKMSGPQAVMSGAILIDKALALERSISETPKTVDFGALADMAKTLKVLQEIAQPAKP